MTGHHKFSQLTQKFSDDRKAKIAAKTAKLKEKMPLADNLPFIVMKCDRIPSLT